MTSYYAVERSSNSLSHYGVKGMKWGVRKAIERGNSKALGRQYRKAERRLAKLQNRANTQHQRNILRAAGRDQRLAATVGLLNTGISAGATALSLQKAYKQATQSPLGIGLGTVYVPTAAGVAAGAIGANAIRKHNAKKRLTTEGHRAAVKEANQFQSEMRKAFKGTEYANKIGDRAKTVARKKRILTESYLRPEDRKEFYQRQKSGQKKKRR